MDVEQITRTHNVDEMTADWVMRLSPLMGGLWLWRLGQVNARSRQVPRGGQCDPAK